MRELAGGGLQLRDPDSALAATDRFRLTTAAAGTLHLSLTIVPCTARIRPMQKILFLQILRNFAQLGILC